MPRSTFFALAEDKRARVVAAAVGEFGAHAYGAASLDRVAAAAGVSKGSLYQYFAGKRDLYTWLLTEHLPTQKRALSTLAAPTERDFFAWLGVAFHGGLRLFRAEPHLAALAARAAAPATDLDAVAVHAALRRLTHDGLCELVRSAMAAGSVRRDVDVDLAAELVAALMGAGLLSCLARRAGLDADAILREPAFAHALDDATLAALVNDAVDLVRRALA